jgi:glucan-binding YG repeat protein
MEEIQMKALSIISTGVLVLLLGAVAPTYAQEEKHEEAKPAAKQEEAKPAAKPAASHAEAKPAAKQEEAKPAASHAEAKPAANRAEAKPAANHAEAKPAANHAEAKPAAKKQEAAHAEQSHTQYAKSGQKDSRGHVYSTSRFGPDHHTRFVETGGREFNGRREFSYGGYWFYAGTYPPWFYQQDVYFVMGPDGLWYAVAVGNPSLTFQVDIE